MHSVCNACSTRLLFDNFMNGTLNLMSVMSYADKARVLWRILLKIMVKQLEQKLIDMLPWVTEFVRKGIQSIFPAGAR